MFSLSFLKCEMVQKSFYNSSHAKAFDPVLTQMLTNENPLHKGLMDKPEFSQGFYFRGDVFSVITVIHLQSRLSPFQNKLPRKAHFWSDGCVVNMQSELKISDSFDLEA